MVFVVIGNSPLLALAPRRSSVGSAVRVHIHGFGDGAFVDSESRSTVPITSGVRPGDVNG
ncbi:hypothetical protein CYV19_18280 [Natronobacterium gregoryi SP2]|uniref:Uncharacterized protein n=1 Tax=Natronobacterium gregoryi (strain ATCC 43098 / DSM 3393 / CCM 3738 / CIP 104747 / IAM 13177 / JCM 8860 / NBRC 102187 / NCIMB 2189 / SP2) TaxID=797304 RepID=A0A2J4JA94_NATGS|nr:hypothetical protein CYV19_18280 [Natronobacterium gregoryi SP2]